MMPFPAVPATPGFVLLALLVAGHLLADFLFQTEGLVAAKRINGRAMLLHGLITGLVQVALLSPMINLPVAYGILLISLSHLVIDAAKVRLVAKFGNRLMLFCGDQLLHGICIFLVWRWLDGQSMTYAALSEAELRWLPRAAGRLARGRGSPATLRKDDRT